MSYYLCNNSNSQYSNDCLYCIIVADKITVESPYRATLTSIFPDGTKRQRKRVEGVLQRKYLNNIRPEYSRVYEIKQVKARAKKYNEDDFNVKKKIDNRHIHTHVHKYNQEDHHNHNDNYFVPDLDEHQKTKNNQKMLSDQMTQKSFTSEKEKELPLVFKGISNSAPQKQLHVSNFAFVYVLTLISTVLSVHLSRNYDNLYSIVLK